MKEIDIKTTQKIAFDILCVIADICEKNNYKYFLIYGTLIGVIRHKGYIPWDDDVDIMMPRNDYDKLLKYLEKNIDKYPNLQVFNHNNCEKYPYMITRISDNRYEIEVKNEKKYGIGVFIDIYPFDGLGDSKEEAIKFGLKGDRLSSFCYQSTRNRYMVENTTSNLKKILKVPVFICAKIIGKDFFQNKLEKLARVKDYESSKYVGCVTWLSGGEKDIFPREWFDEWVMMPFEDSMFRVPKEYDKILKHIYGDYMKLPPEKDRIGHHNYKVFKK